MRGLLALTRTEMRLFRREPFSLVFVLAFPLMMMLLLSAVFGDDQADVNDMENGMLVCVTEVNTRQETDRLAEALAVNG